MIIYFSIMNEHYSIYDNRDYAILVSEFLDRYYKEPEYDSRTEPYHSVYGQAYDHIWMAALALNCTVNELSMSGTNSCKAI